MDKKKNNKTLRDVLISQNAKEAIQQYGGATHEYIKAYTGWDWTNSEIGKSGFAKGLKQVSESQVNPEYIYANLKQQAGFTAEIEYVAKTNADNIIKGNSKRVARSNDIGRGNDQIFDVGQVDKSNTFIEKKGTVFGGAQMKFSGHYGTPKEIQISAQNNIDKMIGTGKWAKYKAVDVLVPSEQIGPMKKYANEQRKQLLNKAKEFSEKDDLEKANLLEARAQEYANCAKHLKDSGISSEEAMEAREYPKWRTAKHIGKTAHSAGVEQAKAGAVIGGIISVVQNTISILNGNKNAKTVLTDIAVETASSAGTGYFIAASGAAIKGVMQSAENGTVRALSKSNLPAMIVTGTMQVGKSFYRYTNGDINEIELAEELGEKGVGALASSWGAAAGSVILPGIGTAIGGTIGYMAASVIYQGAMKVYTDERVSFERRKQIHAFVEEAVLQMRYQRDVLEKVINKRYVMREKIFKQGFEMIQSAVESNDFDSFAVGMNQIVVEMGTALQFKNFADIDRFMKDTDVALEF